MYPHRFTPLMDPDEPDGADGLSTPTEESAGTAPPDQTAPTGDTPDAVGEAALEVTPEVTPFDPTQARLDELSRAVERQAAVIQALQSQPAASPPTPTPGAPQATPQATPGTLPELTPSQQEEMDAGQIAQYEAARAMAAQNAQIIQRLAQVEQNMGGLASAYDTMQRLSHVEPLAETVQSVAAQIAKGQFSTVHPKVNEMIIRDLTDEARAAAKGGLREIPPTEVYRRYGELADKYADLNKELKSTGTKPPGAVIAENRASSVGTSGGASAGTPSDGEKNYTLAERASRLKERLDRTFGRG